eukprot:5555373-Pyramimonas_sp.AAC.1
MGPSTAGPRPKGSRLFQHSTPPLVTRFRPGVQGHFSELVQFGFKRPPRHNFDIRTAPGVRQDAQYVPDM